MVHTTCDRPTGETPAQRVHARGLLVARRAATWTVLLFVVAVAGVVVWSQLPANRGRCCFGRTVLVVGSGSMSPAIEAGDLIMVRRIDATALARIRAGSVVSFRVPEHQTMVVTHRVLEVERSPDGGVVLRTKGDANVYPDSFALHPEDLVGEVVWRAPRLGRVLMNLRTGRFLLAVGLMLVLARVAMALRARATGDVALRSER